jgi:hypothetical protein
MRVKTAEKWSAKEGIASGQTRPVVMLGPELYVAEGGGWGETYGVTDLLFQLSSTI